MKTPEAFVKVTGPCMACFHTKVLGPGPGLATVARFEEAQHAAQHEGGNAQLARLLEAIQG